MRILVEKPNRRRARPSLRMCALLCATALLLGGCSAFDTGGELFALPKVAGFVTELQTEIDTVSAEKRH